MNIFKKYFSRVDANKPKASDDNSISFILDKEGNIKIKLLFESNSNESAQNMARFLYELNNGLLSQSIIDLMLELGKENINYRLFVKDTIMLWLQYISTDTNISSDDNPVIKPSEFSKN